MNRTKRNSVIFMSLFLLSSICTNALFIGQAAAYQDIAFPVLGGGTFGNDFYASRGSRTHNAIDILAPKGRKLLAAAKGTVVRVWYPQPSWGYNLTIEDDNGYRYNYIHINDDRPGTNDGKGGAMNAYAPDMKVGNRVARGQHIGWVGDSGNSNGIPHLHFEMEDPNGKTINPYQSLVHASRPSKPVIPGRVTDELLPFDRYYDGAANIAMGNFDVDLDSEFVVTAGQDADPHVRVYDNDGTLLKKFLAFDVSFEGGVDVALGDVDADGVDEIITAAGLGSSRVKVFEADGTLDEDFEAFAPEVKNGLRVASGDLNGDTRDEIIVGLQAGGQPKIRIYDLVTGDPVLSREFLGFSASFTGGVDVAVGDVNAGSLNEEVVVSTGSGGDPKVRVFSGAGPKLQEFFAYDESMRGGVRVSVGNVSLFSAESEIVTLPASKGPPQVRMFNSAGTLQSSRMFIEEWWIGAYDIAVGYDIAKGMTGTNRRVSVRLGMN